MCVRRGTRKSAPALFFWFIADFREGSANLEEEVMVIAEAIGHALARSRICHDSCRTTLVHDLDRTTWRLSSDLDYFGATAFLLANAKQT